MAIVQVAYGTSIGASQTVNFAAPASIGNAVVAIACYENNDGNVHINGAGWTNFGPVWARNAGDQEQIGAYQTLTSPMAGVNATWTGGRACALYICEIAGTIVDTSGVTLQSSSAAVRTIPNLLAAAGRSGSTFAVWHNSHETYNNVGVITSPTSTLYGDWNSSNRMRVVGGYADIPSLLANNSVTINVATPVGGGNSWCGLAVVAEDFVGGGAPSPSWIPPMPMGLSL